MVRVISVHHFSKQDVGSCPPPTAAVIVADKADDSKSKLVIATENQVLEVRDFRNGAKPSHSFQTIDRVCELLYSAPGKCLITLEGHRGEKGSSVRAYMNWDNPEVDNAPIRPRIASRVTPAQCPAGEAATHLDMVEFPQRDPPLQIGVCPSTGNLVVGAVNLLIIYKQLVRTHEVTKAKFVDYQECFHIFHNFVPRELRLCEDVIACLAPNEVHVFKVKMTEACSLEERSLRSISLYSFTSDSENSGPPSSLVLEPANPQLDASSPSSSASSSTPATAATSFAAKLIPKVIKNITLRRQQDSETTGHDQSHLDGYVGNVKRAANHFTLGQPSEAVLHLPEIAELSQSSACNIEGDIKSGNAAKILEQSLGPCAPPLHRSTAIKCLMSNGGDFETECVSLVHCRLFKGEEGHEAFKNLQLEPVYWREFRVKKTSAASITHLSHPLHSASHPHLMSLTMSFTSHNEGYLYHLPGHLRKTGKGCGVQRIATYPFTSPVCRTAFEPTLMHALTETGLETYTLRSGYHTVLEAESLNLRTNTCPGDGENPICLVGLRPFLGAKHLLVSGCHLVILSRAENGPKWTLYALTLPTPINLHKDMMALADMNRTISPQGYYQLLCEAHMVLRTSLHQLIWSQQQQQQQSASDELKETLEKYQETCLQLGMHHVLCPEEADWLLALPYFRMSRFPAQRVVREAVEHWQKSSSSHSTAQLCEIPAGLLHYVEEVILRPTPTESALDATLADSVIDLLGTHSLSTLALLVLKSRTFRDFKTAKMFHYFEQGLARQTLPDPAQVLAFCLLSVANACPPEEAAKLLKRPMAPIAGVDLSSLLIEHYAFLFDDTADAFSELAVLLRDSVPDLFVEVLVSLIKADLFTVSTMLQLFIGSFVSMSNISGEAAHNAAMLQLFLETYFTELLTDDNDDDENGGEDKANGGSGVTLDQEQEQALQTLVRSYLSSLTVPVRFGDKDIDTDMFGTRHTFLDRLPPFDGQKSAKDALLEAESPEFWCQNSLLKLQSLLCSPVLGLACCHSTVNAYLEMYPDVIGALSLRVLSSPASVSIPLMCHAQPDVLLLYAKEIRPSFGQDDWRHTLTCLHEQLTGSTEDLSDRHEAWYSAMQEVLDHLAQTLALEAFLEVLPNHESHAEDFQGYIQMCRKNQQAADIQNLIVSTGHKLLSSLTL